MNLRYKKKETNYNWLYLFFLTVAGLSLYVIVATGFLDNVYNKHKIDPEKINSQKLNTSDEEEILIFNDDIENILTNVKSNNFENIRKSFVMFAKKPGDAQYIKQFEKTYVPGMVGHDRNILHRMALENRPYPIIQLGTKYPELLNDDDLNGVMPICVALLRGSKEAADAFYKLEKVDYRATDKNGYTVLHYAAKAGHLGITEKALEAGHSPNAKSKSGMTPLIISVQNEHFEVFSLLLEHGGDPKITVGDRDCFHYATYNDKCWNLLQTYAEKDKEKLNFAEETAP